MRDKETLWAQARAQAQAPRDLAEPQTWVDGLHPEERELLITLYCERMAPVIHQTRLTWEKLQKGLTQALAMMMPVIEGILEAFDLAAEEDPQA